MDTKKMSISWRDALQLSCLKSGPLPVELYTEIAKYCHSLVPSVEELRRILQNVGRFSFSKQVYRIRYGDEMALALDLSDAFEVPQAMDVAELCETSLPAVFTKGNKVCIDPQRWPNENDPQKSAKEENFKQYLNALIYQSSWADLLGRSLYT